MQSPWMSDRNEEEESWGDREAWRGEVHADDGESWRGDTGESAWEPPELEGLAPEEDWPEAQAGPEYWMFKDFGSPDR